MNLDKFIGSGSTPSRRAFWDNVSDAVLASQKREGRNASVDEHEGKGTVISFPDQTPSTPGGCSVVFDATVSGSAIIVSAIEGACDECSPAIITETTISGNAPICDETCTCFDGSTVSDDPVVPTECGGYCTTSGEFNAGLTLYTDGIDWFFDLFSRVSQDLGDFPDCAGQCAINSDPFETFNIGPDPSGTWTIDYTGSETGADYHYEITVII